jgi:2,4-dienoyl-CoA reductase-like NADH-dependent reductase (Old Yellow Enzyme family)
MHLPIDPLFEPFTLGNLTFRNRFAMAPMTRNFSPGGVPGADVAGYYQRRAEAGVGLITTEGIGIDHPSAIGSGSMHENNVPVLHGDAVAGWRAVVESVHAAGGIIMPQLWHMGVIRQPGTGPAPDAPSMRPSGVWGPAAGDSSVPPPYREAMLAETAPMRESDIADVIAGFGRSAANARAAGFDGIAIHGAHGYLIDSFFWHETNRRTDSYGGATLAARASFGVEVVRAIRAAVGRDLPIVFRFSQWKIQDYGAALARTPDELATLLGPLADAGVDMFDASMRIITTPPFAGSDRTLAGWAKALTGKPAMGVGGVGLDRDLPSTFAGGTQPVDNLDPVIERVAAGEFDMVAVGRAVLNDPRWIEKARARAGYMPFELASFGQLT